MKKTVKKPTKTEAKIAEQAIKILGEDTIRTAFGM